jgi:hypothetical protein
LSDSPLGRTSDSTSGTSERNIPECIGIAIEPVDDSDPRSARDFITNTARPGKHETNGRVIENVFRNRGAEQSAIGMKCRVLCGKHMSVAAAYVNTELGTCKVQPLEIGRAINVG